MAKNLVTFLGQYSNVTVNTDMKENATCEVFWSIQSGNGVTGLGAGADASHNAEFGGTGSPFVFKWNWIVPAGVSSATFHIWGGGGGGAPGYCCMTGVNGGSGAYAFKTVSVTPGTCYTACYEGSDRYKCANADATSGGLTNQSAPYVMRGCRGFKTYVTGAGLTNFCAEGGSPGATRCGYSYGQNPHSDTPNQFPGSRCCQLWKICHITKRRTIDSDNDVFAPAKYYGADGGSKGIYSCHRTSCCNADDIAANRCGDKHITAFPGGHTPNRWAPFGDNELPSIHGGVIHGKQCNIVVDPHGGYMTSQISAHLGYICADHRSAMIGIGGQSAQVCGGTCCCGAPGGAPFLRIEYS